VDEEGTMSGISDVSILNFSALTSEGTNKNHVLQWCNSGMRRGTKSEGCHLTQPSLEGINREMFCYYFGPCHSKWPILTRRVPLFVAACNADTCHLLYVFCGSRQQRNRRSLGSRYLREGSSKRDKIVQVPREGLMYLITQTSDLWPRGFHWGAKILKGVKKFCNAFLQDGFSYEILHDCALAGSRS